MNRITGAIKYITPLRKLKDNAVGVKLGITNPPYPTENLFADNHMAFHIIQNFSCGDLVLIKFVFNGSKKYVLKIKKIETKDYIYLNQRRENEQNITTRQDRRSP